MPDKTQLELTIEDGATTNQRVINSNQTLLILEDEFPLPRGYQATISRDRRTITLTFPDNSGLRECDIKAHEFAETLAERWGHNNPRTSAVVRPIQRVIDDTA